MVKMDASSDNELPGGEAFLGISVSPQLRVYLVHAKTGEIEIGKF